MESVEFMNRLEEFLSQMKQTRTAQNYSDNRRSDNVFLLPVALKDAFLQFLDETKIPDDQTLLKSEGDIRPFSKVDIGYAQGRYVNHGCYCDCDGFIECDREGITIKCVGWCMCSFYYVTKRMGKVYRKVYTNRGFNNWQWVDGEVLDKEPIVTGKLTRYYQYNEYSENRWVADRNVICFVEEVRDDAK